MDTAIPKLDEGKSTPPKKKKSTPMTQKEIVAGVKHVITTRFRPHELVELKSWLSGAIQVAERSNKS
jgi:hypothetical protein